MVKFVVTFLLSFPEEYFEYQSKTKILGEDKSLLELHLADNFEMRHIKPDVGKRLIRNISYKLPFQRAVETKISILCWKYMAKVYMKKEDIAIETVSYNHHLWVAFTVAHRVNPQDVRHLEDVHSSVVEFKFNDDSHQLLPRVVGDKIGEFYGFIPAHTIENIRFRPVFPTAKYEGSLRGLAGSSESPWTSIHTISACKNQSFTGWNVPLNYLKFKKRQQLEEGIKQCIYPSHLSKIIKSLKNIHSTRSFKRSSLFSRKSFRIHGMSEIITLDVEKLYFDKPVWVLQSKKESIFQTIYCSAISWMTEDARRILNPVGIMIHGIHNLPEKEFSRRRIKYLCIEYDLEPLIPKTRSAIVDIEDYRKTNFKWVKTFLTGQISPIELTSKLQTKKLIIKLFGKYCKSNDDEEAHIFGDDFDDYKLSNLCKAKVTSFKNGTAQHATEFTLLAAAQVDLSPLIFGSSCVLEWATITSKPVKEEYTIDGNYFNRFNTLDVHTDKTVKEYGLLPDASLINTLLKVSAKIGHLLRIQSVKMMVGFEATFSRALAIIDDSSTAASILNAIWKYNKLALNLGENMLPLIPYRNELKDESNLLLKSIFTPVPVQSSFFSLLENSFEEEKSLCSKLLDSKVLSLETDSIVLKKSYTNDYISGFFIDCIEFNILMVEGLVERAFPKVYQHLMTVSTEKGRVLYSSDLIYMERLYEAFKHFGGLYCVTMKKTPLDLLNKKTTYLEGSIPVPAKDLLFSIPLLRNGKSLLHIMQNKQLPTPEELVSFDIEFGTPHCMDIGK